MARFDGHRVSRRWHVVLTAARKAGVDFILTSGKRTMREQWALFRKNMRWDGRRWVPRPGRPLTAYPSPFAPHIRKGRADHALDVNALDGGETRLEAWLRLQGVHPTNPVRGEAWHLELPGRHLKKLARRWTSRFRRPSKACLKLVMEFEGYRKHAYRDPVGVWTIGYGETDPDIIARFRHTGIPERKARKLLKRRLNRDYARHVRALKLPLRQSMGDALTSFVYNLGPGALAPSTGVGKQLRRRNWYRAANELLRWTYAGGRQLPGLVRRREAERTLFLRDLPRKENR